MDKEKTGIKKDISELKEMLRESKGTKGKKQKKFRMPWKARVGKAKLKKGFVTVEIIGENKAVTFEKKAIIGGTIELDGTIHAVDNFDIYYYKGKPFIHQPITKLNPWHPLGQYLNEERIYDGKILAKNEIFGQKYIMARMKSDLIKTKRKIGWGASIFGIVVLGIVAYAFITGG